MANSSNDGPTFDQNRYRNPETALGGADAVEKTSYVTGKGTEPEQREPSGGRKGKAAPNATLIIIGTLLVLAVLVWFLKAYR